MACPELVEGLAVFETWDRLDAYLRGHGPSGECEALDLQRP